MMMWLLGLAIAGVVLGLTSVILVTITMERTRHLASIAAQQDVMETYLAQLVDEILGGFSGSEPGIFRSLDGKHVAGSMEELMMKMSDPTIDEPDTSEQDITNLKEFFKDATDREKESGWKDSDGDDDDDDDDNDKPWLK